MLIKKITAICPSCQGLISLDAEDIEMESDKDIILISFVCPLCTEEIEKEIFEID